MGGGAWSSTAYAARSADYSKKSRSEIFQKRSIYKDFDPKNITIRESCDSDDNPESTALIFGLDVTGSMGFIAEAIAKTQLGKLVEGILADKPVTDPHLMMMAIGDIQCDDYPLQATQFEADIRIADQLVNLYLEGGGGGNSFESYDLPWAFAATKTKIDCFDKRGKKGYLFTIGDEMPPQTASKRLLQESVNIHYQSEMDTKQVLKEAQERYSVFHIIAEEGNYYQRRGSQVYSAWADLLGKKAILLDDHQHLTEVILSVIEVSEGADPDETIEKWQTPAVRRSVERALYGAGQ